jgi:hypothetical protein
MNAASADVSEGTTLAIDPGQPRGGAEAGVLWLPDSSPTPPAQPAEDELNLINLPTFQLTHRFARDRRRGDFGSLPTTCFRWTAGPSSDSNTGSASPVEFNVTRLF